MLDVRARRQARQGAGNKRRKSSRQLRLARAREFVSGFRIVHRETVCAGALRQRPRLAREFPEPPRPIIPARSRTPSLRHMEDRETLRRIFPVLNWLTLGQLISDQLNSDHVVWPISETRSRFLPEREHHC